MNWRKPLTLCSVALLLVTSGCATRYQDLLRDRDMEIRELKGQLADLRADNAELDRQRTAAQGRISELESQPVPANASDDGGELARVQGELSDLDVRYERGRISIGIQNTVTFDSGSTALKSSSHGVLRRVATVLRRDYPERRIYVEGHTDTDPIKKTRGRFRSNRHLSAERADSVAQFLTSKTGLAADHVVVVGYGEHHPRDPGSSKAAKARNRRVEIVVGETL